MRTSLGYASRPFIQGLPCGDGFVTLQLGPIQRLMLTDGIGHGPHAFRIVDDLNQQLIWLSQRSQAYRISLGECLQNLHGLLRQRGHDHQAAMALLDLDPSERTLEAIIIGNIEVHIHRPGFHLCLPAQAGMVGGRLPSQPRPLRHAVDEGTLLSLFSDGVDGRNAQLGLQAMVERGSLHRLDMQAEADAVLRILARPTDDASCVLLRLQGEHQP